MVGRARRAAADELAELGRAYWELDRNPTPATWCHAAGVRLEVTHQVKDGRYRRLPEPSITLRPNHQMHRPTFTLCHELAHHLLEECRSNSDIRSLLSDDVRRFLAAMPVASENEEKLCDKIAAALLLHPEDIQTWAGRPPTLDSLLSLAGRRHLTAEEACDRICEATGQRLSLIEGNVVSPGCIRVTDVKYDRWVLPHPMHVSARFQSPAHAGTWYAWDTAGGETLLVRATQALLATGSVGLLVTLVTQHADPVRDQSKD